MGGVEHLENVVSSGDLVLDIGSKNGRDMGKIPGMTVATDLELQSTDEETEYAYADATALPFKSDSFDYILCDQVLEHLPQKEALIAEAARVLAPDGEALFSFPNRIAPTRPHSPPGWYSWLPREWGLRLSDRLLDSTTALYYRESVFNLSPVAARRLMESYFDDVDYVTFEFKRDYGKKQLERNPTGNSRTLRQLVYSISGALDQVVDVPVLGRTVEIVYPHVAYRCRAPLDCHARDSN